VAQIVQLIIFRLPNNSQLASSVFLRWIKDSGFSSLANIFTLFIKPTIHLFRSHLRLCIHYDVLNIVQLAYFRA